MVSQCPDRATLTFPGASIITLALESTGEENSVPIAMAAPDPRSRLLDHWTILSVRFVKNERRSGRAFSFSKRRRFPPTMSDNSTGICVSTWTTSIGTSNGFCIVTKMEKSEPEVTSGVEIDTSSRSDPLIGRRSLSGKRLSSVEAATSWSGMNVHPVKRLALWTNIRTGTLAELSSLGGQIEPEARRCRRGCRDYWHQSRE